MFKNQIPHVLSYDSAVFARMLREALQIFLFEVNNEFPPFLELRAFHVHTISAWAHESKTHVYTIILRWALRIQR